MSLVFFISKQFPLPTSTSIKWHSDSTRSRLTLSRSWHAAPTLGHSGTCRMSDLTCSNSLLEVAMFHNRSHLVALTLSLSTWWDKSINKELQIKLFLRLLVGWVVSAGVVVACLIFVIILIIHNNKGNTNNVQCPLQLSRGGAGTGAVEEDPGPRTRVLQPEQPVASHQPRHQQPTNTTTGSSVSL